MFQLNLMKSIQESIKADRFPAYVQTFMATMFPNKDYPAWVIEALASVNIQLS